MYSKQMGCEVLLSAGSYTTRRDEMFRSASETGAIVHENACFLQKSRSAAIKTMPKPVRFVGI